MMNCLLFPPNTREVQFDEKWSFVRKKQDHCTPAELKSAGDNWDHVALDPEHKLVVSLVAGKRTKANTDKLVADFKRRTAGRPMRLISSDEYKPYKDAILKEYGQRIERPRRFRQGRAPLPRLVPTPELLYATVHKHRRNGRVVDVTQHLIYGTQEQLSQALAASQCSRALNTAFVERYNGTDRHRNSRKVRKTYRFSKDWEMHNAATQFTTGTYNFCWPVRTLLDANGKPQTPAMSAGLSDRIWTLQQWLNHPVKHHLVI
jgi:IS1 family transposase